MNEQEVQRKLEELKSDYDLTDEMLNEKCSEQHTFALEDIISDWKLVGPRLQGIEQQDIHDNVKGSEKLKRRELLKEWHQRNGDKATYRDMVRALLLEKKVEDATKVCKLLLPQNGKYRVVYNNHVRTDVEGWTFSEAP